MWNSKRDPDWPLPDRPDHPFYREVLRLAYDEGDFALLREAALNDFWFFTRYVLSLGKLLCDDLFSTHHGRPWIDHPWLFARCRELQDSPNGHLDLWARYHFKTSLITQSLTLWDLADNPNIRFAIITYKIDTVGSSFLVQIKKECEDNELLRELFPGTFWADPRKQSPSWTLDSLCMKQALNPKEPTISLGSLKAGLTGLHVNVRVWDDCVTDENVRSTDAIDDTTTRIRNFAGTGGDFTLDRFTGTHWALGDSYEALINAGIVKLRYHDVYEEDGATPVLRSAEWCDQMYKHMTLIGGTAHWSCVMRNRPELSGDLHFEVSWLRYYDEDPLEARKRMNVYIVIDTATTRNKTSDFSVLSVIGLAKGVPYGHYYLLDMVRDRLGLVETQQILFALVAKWMPTYVMIEQQGSARDSEHFRAAMEDEKFFFRLLPFEDKMPKIDRIRRLEPVFKTGRFHLPKKLPSKSDGRPVDLVHEFVRHEYRVWTPTHPSRYDDMLDTFSQILSPKVKSVIRFPTDAPLPYVDREPDAYREAHRRRRHRPRSADAAWAL